MTKQRGRIVYSTDGGRHCPDCGAPREACRCRETTTTPAGGDGIVRLRRESKGRGGKVVTIVDGLPLTDTALKATAKRLKQRCGVGGAVRGATIELQGDQREAILPVLQAEGYTVKIAGG